MDLGFAGLIEEIEKRFGKFVTTIMLGMLLLAIILWALKLVMGLFVEVDRLFATGSAGDQALGVLMRLGFFVVAVAAVLGWATLRLRKFSEVADERAKALKADLAYNQEFRAEVEALMEKVEVRANEVAEQQDELAQLRDEIRQQIEERDR